MERSALTLKGLVISRTGAVAAAATTSLPEAPGGERNWDYRYVWIRDATLTLWSLADLGFTAEADAFLSFLASRAEADGELRVMYGADGQDASYETVLDHLAGYLDARPVRVGNAAGAQRQHDVWGAVVGLIHLHTRSRDSLDPRLWRLVIAQVERAIEQWSQRDHGPWEVRGQPQHFTASKVICWLAADRGTRLAEKQSDLERARRWRARAEEIREDILANAVDARGVFTQHYDTTALDAATLIVPLVGFLPPDDFRVRRTVLAIADELTQDELVLRYRPEETEDGCVGGEGTFSLCSFWLVSALVLIGEGDRARVLCEKLLSYSGELGLYAEEIDPRTGDQLGNFPQALTHLALTHAVAHVISADPTAAQDDLDRPETRRSEPWPLSAAA